MERQPGEHFKHFILHVTFVAKVHAVATADGSIKLLGEDEETEMSACLSGLQNGRMGELCQQAMVTDKPYRFNGNVMNTGMIPNLPDGSCVEVPCLVDAQGVQPCYVGKLPAQLAALNLSNIVVQELAVRAVIDKDRDAAFHACAMDPLTRSVCSLDQTRAMFEELWEAEGELLAYFK